MIRVASRYNRWKKCLGRRERCRTYEKNAEKINWGLIYKISYDLS